MRPRLRFVELLREPTTCGQCRRLTLYVVVLACRYGRRYAVTICTSCDGDDVMARTL